MKHTIEDLARKTVSAQGAQLELFHIMYLKDKSNVKLIKYFSQIRELGLTERREGVSTKLCLKVLKLAIINKDHDLITAMRKTPELFSDIKKFFEFDFVKGLKKVVVDAKEKYCKKSENQFAKGLFSRHGFMGRFRDHLQLTGFGKDLSFDVEETYQLVKSSIAMTGGVTEIFTHQLIDFLKTGPGNYHKGSYKTMLMEEIVEFTGLDIQIDSEDSRKSLNNFIENFNALVTAISELNEGFDCVKASKIMDNPASVLQDNNLYEGPSADDLKHENDDEHPVSFQY